MTFRGDREAGRSWSPGPDRTLSGHLCCWLRSPAKALCSPANVPTQAGRWHCSHSQSQRPREAWHCGSPSPHPAFSSWPPWPSLPVFLHPCWILAASQAPCPGGHPSALLQAPLLWCCTQPLSEPGSGLGSGLRRCPPSLLPSHSVIRGSGQLSMP